MTMILNNTGTQVEFNLINPSTKRSILDEFMAKCAKYVKHLDVTDLQFPVNEQKHHLLREALKQEQTSLNTIHSYSSKNGMELNDAIRNELNTAFKKELSQASTLIEGIQNGVGAKSKIIDRLFNSEVIVKNPVNKKFWPLINTSHTFAITHFEEIKTDDGAIIYKINAECDFTILMPKPKDNIDFHGKTELLMAMNNKNLVVIEESYDWPINFVAEEEKQMLEIIHDGIHHDFAMRGAFKEDAAA